MTETSTGTFRGKVGQRALKNNQELGRPALMMGKAAKAGVEGNNTVAC